jgi:acyl-CoA synthetase (AMP-forming)/AMP-acid ligase II
MALLGEHLERHARARPDALAHSCADFAWTYGELREQVAVHATAMAASGVGRGDVVAVFGHSRPEAFAAFLACCRLGALYLGLNPKHTADELEYALGDARPRLALALHEPHADLGAVRLDAFLARGGGKAPPVAGREDDPCAIVYTSGSTGAPKGALLSQRSMVRSAELTLEHWFAAGEELRTVAQHPINHVGWLVCECMTALIAGGALFFRERFDGAATLRLIEHERLTLWLAFPSMLLLAMRTPEFEACDLSSLRRIAIGSQPSLELLERLRAHSSAVMCVSYGLTEAGGGAVTATDAGAPPATVADTIGRGVGGIELRVVDEAGADVEPGAVGELLVRDGCVFSGYLNRPAATAATIDADGWLHTGDAVAQLPDGNLRLAGRLKEMFKSGGYNVYPTEVEAVIGAHHAVSAVAVVAVPDPLWGEVGVAFVVLKAAADVDHLRTHARAHLANYKVPKRFIVVRDLPQLPNGKTDKVRLRKSINRSLDRTVELL